MAFKDQTTGIGWPCGQIECGEVAKPDEYGASGKMTSEEMDGWS